MHFGKVWPIMMDTQHNYVQYEIKNEQFKSLYQMRTTAFHTYDMSSTKIAKFVYNNNEKGNEMKKYNNDKRTT